ncbi:MAG: PfkB family carbohydrate kinase [Chloroflexota bacterium]|nr:PfkB family carbohydrate kinase [Chloroflexota bacterium]
MHCPGTNAHFGAEHVDLNVSQNAKIVHIGYPPLLPRMYEDDGAELLKLFKSLKAVGVITSLDMALPDALSPSGQANWEFILRQVLPYVDIFVPSFEEIVFMLRRSDYDKYRDNFHKLLSRSYVDGINKELVALGAAVAGIKCGEDGIMMRTGSRERMDTLRTRLMLDEDWNEGTAWHPAFRVNLVGTTGAGDSAYAGLLTAILRGASLTNTARWACAVGACNVEAADSTSGVRSYANTAARLATQWDVLPSRLE